MADIRGEDMDLADAGWWSLFIVAVGGFLGWRIKSAQDSVHLSLLVTEVQKMNARLSKLENKLPDAARSDERINGMARTLMRHERVLERKADK